MSSCSLCKKVASDSDSVTCDICHKPVHNNCAGLSKVEVDCLRSKRRRVNFYCDNCDIVSTINELKSNILELKTELETLKNNANHSGPDPNKKLSISENDMIAEFEDRQERANNLILYNLRESDRDAPNERKNDDMSRCKNILLANNLNPENIHVASCIRIGKFNEGKNRLLKIVFDTPKQALDVLRSYKVRDNLYLNKDLTAYQRNISYNIRKEFRERKSSGENDIMLRYKHGIPRIIKAKNE